MKCDDICGNDWKNNRTGFNDNEFCLNCYTSQDYIHLTIADYCKRIENPNWWCIQLKCATWEPYPDRRANHVENSKEVRLAPNLDDNQSTEELSIKTRGGLSCKRCKKWCERLCKHNTVPWWYRSTKSP